MQTYSIEAILISVFLTFIFSGLLGALFKDWLDRARPSLFLTSFTFRGGEDLLQVPDAIINKTHKSAWMSKLRRYESYASLKLRAQEAKRIVSRLKLSREAVDEWLSKYKSWEQKNPGVASFDELGQCPFFNDDFFVGCLFVAARRAEINVGPVPIPELEKLPVVTELVQKSDGEYWLYMADRYVSVPIHKAHSEIEKNALKTIGGSFSRGSKVNIYHYIKEARQKMSDDAARLNEFIEELELFLLPESFLSVKANVVNSGAKPLIFRHVGKITFHNEELNDASIQLRVSDGSTHRSGTSSEQTIIVGGRPGEKQRDRSDGDEVRVQDPFPTGKNSSYFFVPPKSNVYIELGSVAPLRKAAKRVLSMYDASVLRCSVDLLTIEDKSFKASKVLFGKEITQRDAELLKLAKSGENEG